MTSESNNSNESIKDAQTVAADYLCFCEEIVKTDTAISGSVLVNLVTSHYLVHILQTVLYFTDRHFTDWSVK